MSRAIEDLQAGLTTIRPWMLACSLVLAGGLMLALEAALARGLVWKLPVGWVLATPHDDWSHAAWQIHRLRRDAGGAPVVVFIGGSAVREAVSGSAAMTAALSERAGRPMRFINLGTRDQNLAERLLLVDQLPRIEQGVVVFSMHPLFLRDGPEDWAIAAKGVRFPLASPALAKAVAGIAPQLSGDSGWHVLRFRPQVGNWIKRRTAQRAVFRRLSYIEHMKEKAGPMSEQALADTMRMIGPELQHYPTYRDANLELLAHAVRLATTRGYRVILMDLPRNPVCDHALFRQVLADYSEAVSQLARHLDVPYVDMHAQLAFAREDFHDHVHFLRTSRPRFEAAFIERVLRSETR